MWKLGRDGLQIIAHNARPGWTMLWCKTHFGWWTSSEVAEPSWWLSASETPNSRESAAETLSALRSATAWRQKIAQSLETAAAWQSSSWRLSRTTGRSGDSGFESRAEGHATRTSAAQRLGDAAKPWQVRAKASRVQGSQLQLRTLPPADMLPDAHRGSGRMGRLPVLAVCLLPAAASPIAGCTAATSLGERLLCANNMST